MGQINGLKDIQGKKQKHLLRLVTNSFYRELLKYGFERHDLVNVSVTLLDNVTSEESSQSKIEYYNDIFKIHDIKDDWVQLQRIAMGEVTLRALNKKDVTVVCSWLDNPEIRETFITLFPRTEPELKDYYFKNKDRTYFAIEFMGQFVGLIGADNQETESRKIEMKKLVGAPGYRGKGIGKKATFLFLYYVFEILHYNKVYIHSIDTNIKNINLNSKFGFELEGILYQDIQLLGKFRDVLRMGLLKSTWQEIFNPLR